MKGLATKREEGTSGRTGFEPQEMVLKALGRLCGPRLGRQEGRERIQVNSVLGLEWEGLVEEWLGEPQGQAVEAVDVQ